MLSIEHRSSNCSHSTTNSPDYRRKQQVDVIIDIVPVDWSSDLSVDRSIDSSRMRSDFISQPYLRSDHYDTRLQQGSVWWKGTFWSIFVVDLPCAGKTHLHCSLLRELLMLILCMVIWDGTMNGSTPRGNFPFSYRANSHGTLNVGSH